MWFGRHDPEAKRAPKGDLSETPASEKVTLQWRESMRHATERRWTVDKG